MNTITTTRTIGALAITASALGMGLGAAPAAQAANGPNMQLPFPCGEVWNGNNGNSSAHRTPYETDFNWGSSAEADWTKPAAAQISKGGGAAFCVRLTLSLNAPETLRGASASIHVPVTVEQKAS